MAEEVTQVNIPKSLAEELEKRAKTTGFSSVSSYVTYILKQVLSGIEKKKDELTEEEKTKVREELKGMGYIQE